MSKNWISEQDKLPLPVYLTYGQHNDGKNNNTQFYRYKIKRGRVEKRNEAKFDRNTCVVRVIGSSYKSLFKTNFEETRDRQRSRDNLLFVFDLKTYEKIFKTD